MWRAAISRNTASSKISKAINDVKKISDTASSISRNTTSSKICNAMMTSNKISYAASSYRSVCVAAWITSKKLWTVAAEQPRHGQCATEKKSAAWEISPRPMWENAQKKWQPEQPLHGQCGVLNAQKKWQPGQPLHGQCGVLNTQKKWQPIATSPARRPHEVGEAGFPDEPKAPHFLGLARVPDQHLLGLARVPERPEQQCVIFSFSSGISWQQPILLKFSPIVKSK